MREYKPEFDSEFIEQGRKVLQSVINQPGPNQQRPCPSCKEPCACSGSAACACNCSWDCPSLPSQLSSDPDHYPIEKEIIPLVYAINSLGCCPSYWSCEGHENSAGELTSPPRVNFYSNSTVLPSLITECLAVLAFKKVIRFRWKVTAVGMTEKLQSQYMIEPDISRGVKSQLPLLREDVKQIAGSLFSGVKQKAQYRMQLLE